MNKNLKATPEIPNKRILPYIQKPLYRTRKDINDWNRAYQLAFADEPKNYALQQLYDEIATDALLSSQIENRKQQIFSLDFSLKNTIGDIQEEQTLSLKKLPSYRNMLKAILDTIYYGYNLIECDIITLKDGRRDLKIEVLPRTNVVPQKGAFYKDYSESKFTFYRELPEYGRFILEFRQDGVGLLNKTVAHVLFKRFAQSCWSELCEIYGIPPRVMKTNTSDPRQLNKATQMMKDMGAAAWFVIDTTEQFEWAQGVSTDGNVYDNLITLCNNEISLLISGAIIGQDTKNGSRSKDEAAQDMLWQLIQSDMAMVEDYMNNTVLPAYAQNGILSPGLYFEFGQAEDIEQLFRFTQGLLPFKNIEDEWIEEKFGIKVSGDRSILPGIDSLKADESFFV
ncbi:MAG: DUF935 domain-containing protein [Chitinophagales bacterium]|nr:DUF935 domain-containing protein [Chitinophagales bacterium]